MFFLFLSAKKLGLKWPEEEDLDLNPKDGVRIWAYDTEEQEKADLLVWKTHVKKRRKRIPDERNFFD